MAKKNEELFKKQAVLAAVKDYLPGGKSIDELSGDEILSVFDEQVQDFIVDHSGKVVAEDGGENINVAKVWKEEPDKRQLPVYIYENAGKKFYIFPMRGKGLWDDIWGNIALGPDLNEVVGVAFDHKAETPGLGAEIKDNPKFAAQFVGKKIFDARGQFVSIVLKKGGASPEDPHAVDGISGATLTADGVTAMLRDALSWYLPYIESVKAQQKK